MRPTHLRLVSSGKTPLTPFQRIEAALERMLTDARRMRIAASSLARSKREVMVAADWIERHIPRFGEAKRRLLVERDRAWEIASDAAIVEQRILQSSPGNLAPLLTGLPARLRVA